HQPRAARRRDQTRRLLPGHSGAPRRDARPGRRVRPRLVRPPAHRPCGLLPLPGALPPAGWPGGSGMIRRYAPWLVLLLFLGIAAAVSLLAAGPSTPP